MADGVAKRYIASMAARSTWKRPVDDFVEQSPHINLCSMGSTTLGSTSKAWALESIMRFMKLLADLSY